VLAAGTIGTTYLLLRNRAGLPALSPALGSRFSGNGDSLGFARSCRRTTEHGGGARAIDPSRGPVITSYIRFPDGMDGEAGGAPRDRRGFYIEDAGWPEFANWLVQVFDTPGLVLRGISRAARTKRQYLERDPDSDVAAETERLLGDADLTNSTLGMLGMGRDVPDGHFRLRGRSRLDLDWTERTSRPFFDQMRLQMKAITEALGGKFLDNPTHGMLGRLITVHPLGGCPMGNDAREGVADSYGNVFGHENLYITDGSAMPGPVGANPSLTIAAFAERCVRRMLEEEAR
jgi:cholesterol oxidase